MSKWIRWEHLSHFVPNAHIIVAKSSGVTVACLFTLTDTLVGPVAQLVTCQSDAYGAMELEVDSLHGALLAQTCRGDSSTIKLLLGITSLFT
jgi:hypothetical protein